MRRSASRPQAGIPLKIAAKVDRVDEEYFKTTIEPLLSMGQVEFIGEIREDQKQEFLGNAAGLLFPIAWREPFGLVMIEAMACGTPVDRVRQRLGAGGHRARAHRLHRAQ